MSNLVLLTGPMYSGKSFSLIRELDVAALAQKKVLAIKPALDTRTSASIMARRRDPSDPTKFSPHMEYPAVPIASRREFRDAVYHVHLPEVLGIDELQFFKPWIVDEVFQLLRAYPNIRVIASGLDADFTRKPFPVVARFMPMASEIVKVAAVCFSCKELAHYTQKLRGSNASVEVDAQCSADLYEARCARCHTIYRT